MIQVGHFYSIRKEGQERKKRAKFLYDIHFVLKLGKISLKPSIHSNDGYIFVFRHVDNKNVCVCWNIRALG